MSQVCIYRVANCPPAGATEEGSVPVGPSVTGLARPHQPEARNLRQKR